MVATHIRQRDYPDLLTKLIGGKTSGASLRECVLQSLLELFNTRLAKDDSLEDFPYVQTSVLRYGIRGPSGNVADQVEYAAHLLGAIGAFEPRLSSVEIVPAHVEEDLPQTGWLFQITGLLHEPFRESIRCFVFFDLIDGKAVIF